MLSFSDACDRNRDPILRILRSEFAGVSRVLEIGSGTGQHAVWFGQHLPQLTWQTSDRHEYLPGIRERLAVEGTDNVLPPLELDVRAARWPVVSVDGVFSANTLHIMAEDCVPEFFRGAGEVLSPGGILVVYGPVRYNGQYTSDSNARFDRMLRERDPMSGIRDFEVLDELAERHGLELLRDHSMPANNQLLVWACQP